MSILSTNFKNTYGYLRIQILTTDNTNKVFLQNQPNNQIWDTLHSSRHGHDNHQFNILGDSNCILKPKTTEEVSQILAFCNANRIAVCPQGGNTGLVGGSVPVFDEVVVCTSLMNQIYSINDTSGTYIRITPNLFE